MFDHVVVSRLQKSGLDVSSMDMYSFGVYSGSTMVRFQNFMKANSVKPHAIYGFDSFCGLPDESDGVQMYEKHTRGQFSSKEFFQTDVVDDIINEISKKLEYRDITKFVQGFYEDSLVDDICSEHNMRPAAFVEVDVDLYASTKTLLDFMHRNRLLVGGTIIYYDDWGGVKEFTGGESLAHKEFCDKNGVECECIFDHGDGNPHRKKIFEIRGI